MEKALLELASYIKNGDLIILESTVSVGTNKKLYELLKSHVAKTTEFFYCYCPESILPGNIFYEIATNFRVLGGITPLAAQKAQKIYDLINTGVKKTTDVTTAEFAKLVQNAHRDVELAFVNQLSIMCEQEGVNPMEVIEITNLHPRCKLLQPGSGVGGHCIAVDPYFLIERFDKDASLLKTARQINDYKPIYIAQKAIALIEGNVTKNIGILGLGYKADCEDCRESSGITISKYLQNQGYQILANEINSGKKIIFGILNTAMEEVIKNSDVIIIAQNHKAYQGLDFMGKTVIDCVNLLGRKKLV